MKKGETSGNIVTSSAPKYENPFSKAEKNMKDQEKFNTPSRDKTHMKPLTQKFFMDMLSLEIEMTNRAFKFTTIEQLVQLYAVKSLILIH